MRAGGIKKINAHHVDDAGFDKSLPLTKNKKQYDISYVNERGEIILIEIMRTYWGVLGASGMPSLKKNKGSGEKR